MTSWLIDFTTYIRVVSNDKPNDEEARAYIERETGQVLDNAHIKITRC